tara:strand:+ start:219 stop:887 length:669 start_codon:yes stop_codon:yes gene_type:complete
MKNLLFSAIFGLKGNYEKIDLPDGWDCIIFTDNSNVVKADPCWTVKVMQKPHKDNRLCNRYYKWKIHEICPDYDMCFYVDSKWILQEKILFHIKEYSFDLGIFFNHFHRTCTYKELGFVSKKGKDKKENIINWKKYIEKKQFPRNYGLTENSIFIRSLKDESLNDCCNRVYTYLEQGKIQRDQLCFMFLLWKCNLKDKLLFVEHNIKETNFIKTKFEKKFLK